MTDKPNPADFSVDGRLREYDVVIRIEGTMRTKIMADSLDEAETMAERLADDIAEDREPADIDDVDDVSVEDCRKSPPMFRVLRDGRACKVSRLAPGDLPREPDERGF